MKQISVGTIVLVSTLTAVNVDAAVNTDKIQNNVLRRIVSEAQQSVAIGDKNRVQEWEQSWPQWSQCHNPNGC